MTPPELRRLAAKVEAAGSGDLAVKLRNRAARRELGVERLEGRSAQGHSSLVQEDLMPARRDRPRKKDG